MALSKNFTLAPFNYLTRVFLSSIIMPTFSGSNHITVSVLSLPLSGNIHQVRFYSGSSNVIDEICYTYMLIDIPSLNYRVFPLLNTASFSSSATLTTNYPVSFGIPSKFYPAVDHCFIGLAAITSP